MCATVQIKSPPLQNAERLHRAKNATVAHWGGGFLFEDQMPVTLTCQICGDSFSVIPSRSKTAKYCDYTCHQIGEGRKGGEVTGSIKKKLSLKKSYIKFHGRHLHRRVAELKLGRNLLPGEIVHHKDENIFNNNPDNIEVLPSQGEHVKRHCMKMLAQRKIKHGY